MQNVILTTPEELRKVVSDVIKELLSPLSLNKGVIDTVTLSDALSFLLENGFPTSKAKMYRLTSTNQVPHKIYGNKLIFSRKELLEWASKQVLPRK